MQKVAKMSCQALILGFVLVTQTLSSIANENQCVLQDSMDLGNENCTFNKIPTHHCWYTLECSPPARTLWEAWCGTTVAYLKKKEKVKDKRWKQRCLKKIRSHRTFTFRAGRIKEEFCKDADLSCRRKVFVQFNGTSIRKIRWCNCSLTNRENGTKISQSASGVPGSSSTSSAEPSLRKPSPSPSRLLSPLHSSYTSPTLSSSLLFSLSANAPSSPLPSSSLNPKPSSSPSPSPSTSASPSPSPNAPSSPLPSSTLKPKPSSSPFLSPTTSALPSPSPSPNATLSSLPLSSFKSKPSSSPSLSPSSTSASPSPSPSPNAPSSFLPLSSPKPSPSSSISPCPSTSSLPSPSATRFTTETTASITTKEFLSALNETDVKNKSSIEKVVSLLETTMKKFKNRMISQEQPTKQEQERSFFKSTAAFEEFVLNYGQNHLNDTLPRIFSNSEIVLQIQRVFLQNVSDFRLGSSEEENYIKVPYQNFNKNGSVIAGVIYKELPEIFIGAQLNKNKRRLNSKIMAVSMYPSPKRLQENITLKFKILKDLKGDCMFWNYSKESNPKGWSRQGCHVVKSNSDETECSCNHMTPFAVLTNPGATFEELDNLLQDLTSQFKGGNVQAEDVFKELTKIEDFLLTFGSRHLNGSAPLLYNSKEVSLRLQQISSQNGSSFHLETSGNQNFIKVPSENVGRNGSVVLGVVYKQLHNLFPTTQSDIAVAKNARRLNSNVMAVVMHPKPKTLQENITLKFPNLKALDGDCMFWDDSNESNPKDWSGRGCRAVPSVNSSNETECTCNHLTHFAVLFNYGNDPPNLTGTDETILEILTYVGLALSIVGVILTIICYAILTDVHQPLSQIRVSLAGSLGAAQIVFLVGINRTENRSACVAVAALMQYFLMAAFCWMLVEGVHLYLFVVKVYNVSNKIKLYRGLSWGFPVVMVGISLSVAAGKDGIQSFVSDKYCWMSSNNTPMWIFVAFVAMIEFINFVILVRVVKEMAKMQHTKDNMTEQIRIGIKACVVMVPLLGVTWLFGFLSPLHKAFFYIFTILNSIQGFLIFLLHCVRNSQIRERLKTRIIAKSSLKSDKKRAAKKTSEVKQLEDDAQQCLFELK
ncbi:uncharacterized protein LOC144664632 isoform X2 [Oculina patagonica]